jgi:ribokinase
MKKFDVVCFGSAVVDAFVKTHTMEDGKHILIPYGSKILMQDLNFEIGGGGTNTSVAFSRLGLKTGYIGKLGKDANGDKIFDLIKNEKITFLGKRVKGTTSGFSVILLSKKLYRSVLTYKGINDEIGLNDFKKFKSDWLYFSSLLGKSFETQIQLAKRMKAKGTKIAFNPSEYLIKRKNLSRFLKLVDIVILNKEEAALLTKDKDKLKGISKFGPKTVVITDGEKRVYAYDNGSVYSAEPPKVKIIEKTGAGDAFASGFVAGKIRGKKVEECLKLGIREGTAVVRNFGTKAHLIKMNLK